MTTQQLILSLVLATMVFSVALELRVSDFRRVAQTPRAVVCGLIPQFILLPVGTWLATLALDLPPNVEAAMILVAACPGGSLSNVVTHLGRGNTALSVSVSAVASIIALVATPFNFSWMVAANPATAGWLKRLDIDPSGIWISLFLLLALPMALGLLFSHQLPALTARIRKPLGNFSLLALLAFIVLGLIKERQLLTLGLLPMLGIVIAHNASGLFFGWATSKAMGVSERDRRAVMIEGGMQNSGLKALRRLWPTSACRTAASWPSAPSPWRRATRWTPAAPGSCPALWTSTPTTTARPPGTKPSAPASTMA
jgi:BASS family bile acid:Na+ symporter